MITTLFALLLILAVLCACATVAAADDSKAETVSSVSDVSVSDSDTDSEDDEITGRILLQDGASTSDSKNVSINGDLITVNEAGTYLVSGSLGNGQIRIDTDKESKVKLILDGVDVSNSSSAAIYVVSADKLVVSLADGSTNTLCSTGSFVQTDDNNVDAAVFSKDDLTISGGGTLTVSSSEGHGIVCKNDLKIKNGRITISAMNKGISANDSITFDGGEVSIVSGDDAVNCEGEVTVNAGLLSLSTEDDGIHADVSLTVCGGTIDITESHEGLEANDILISGGTVSIVSEDDGINAAGGRDGSGGDGFLGFMGDTPLNETGSTLSVTGGSVTINAQGDGLDANGDLLISGGTIYISGPTASGNGAMDFTSGSISGGTLIAAGSSGMAVNFGGGSTQGSILYHFSGTIPAGTEVSLKDADGKTIAAFTPEKSFQSVVISCPNIEQGAEYMLTAGSQSAEITMSSLIYGSGNAAGMGGMGREGLVPNNGGMPYGNGERPVNEAEGSFPQHGYGPGGRGQGGPGFAPRG